MIVSDVLAILVAIGLGVNFLRSKKCFVVWLFESTGFIGYLIKSVCILLLVVTALQRIDFSFLTYEIF